MPANPAAAVAYYRTSSAANVGGDSLSRQQHAVRAFAKRQGLEIVEELYDPAVSGKDPIDTRPGFSALLDRKTGERRSLREIARELAALGYLSRSGRPYGAESVKRMLAAKARR